ncbi:MAG: gamma-glutamyltransferase [Actinobacteria bacterium]|nr:gamma-glutamyltransferase [Actinomycetota bacterium]
MRGARAWRFGDRRRDRRPDGVAVVEPQSSGLGGGTLITYFDRDTGEVRFFDGLARAPQRVTDGLRTPTAEEQERFGIADFESEVAATGRAVGVPGTLRVLDLVHDRYGQLAWDELFDPAVELAETGFAMPPYLHDVMSASTRGLERCDYPDLGARYCDGATPIPVGEPVTNDDLADVLRDVRDGGADAFYDADGAIAPAIVERITRTPYKLETDASGPAVIPSLVTVDDIAGYEAVERDPLCAAVLRRVVCSSAPPAFGGLTVLYELELLERGRVRRTRPATLERVHLAIEASRLAQFDRREYVGDPDFQPVPTDALLSDAYLDERFALFSPDDAVHPVEPGDPTQVSARGAGDDATPGDVADLVDTTSHVSIVDRRGDAVSMTTTINSSFGAQLEVRGMALNNVQENFTRLDSISPGKPANIMEPNKRPRTSMAPTLVFDRRHRLRLVVGAAGGSAIPDYVTQTILGVVVDHTDPQRAINRGHWSGQSITSNCAGIIGARSELEEGSEVADLLDDLEAIGHPCPRLDDLRSGLTAIQLVGRRLLRGAADPRRDGIAVGF